MDHIMRELLALLFTIQQSSKGSIGGIDNTYMPQLNTDYIDHLTDRMIRYIDYITQQEKA